MQLLRTDEHYRVVGFPYHDGALEAVVLDDTTSAVRLVVRSLAGEPRTVILRRVQVFRADCVREGNTILLMRALPVACAAARPDVCEILRDRLFIESPRLPSDGFVFLLESSFGAEIVAVCGDIEVVEGRVWPPSLDVDNRP